MEQGKLKGEEKSSKMYLRMGKDLKSMAKPRHQRHCEWTEVQSVWNMMILG